MAGTSLELISNMAEARRLLGLSFHCQIASQLLLKYDLCGVETDAGCLGEMCGLIPETFALLVDTTESANRNGLFKAEEVLYKS